MTCEQLIAIEESDRSPAEMSNAELVAMAGHLARCGVCGDRIKKRLDKADPAVRSVCEKLADCEIARVKKALLNDSELSS